MTFHMQQVSRSKSVVPPPVKQFEWSKQLLFPQKLFHVVNDGYLIYWTEDGKKLVCNEELYESEVMRRYPGFVQIPTFANLRRQLRQYGFEWKVNNEGDIEFIHSSFVRGHPEFLSNVLTKRKCGVTESLSFDAIEAGDSLLNSDQALEERPVKTRRLVNQQAVDDCMSRFQPVDAKSATVCTPVGPRILFHPYQTAASGDMQPLPRLAPGAQFGVGAAPTGPFSSLLNSDDCKVTTHSEQQLPNVHGTHSVEMVKAQGDNAGDLSSASCNPTGIPGGNVQPAGWWPHPQMGLFPPPPSWAPALNPCWPYPPPLRHLSPMKVPPVMYWNDEAKTKESSTQTDFAVPSEGFAPLAHDASLTGEL